MKITNLIKLVFIYNTMQQWLYGNVCVHMLEVPVTDRNQYYFMVTVQHTFDTLLI